MTIQKINMPKARISLLVRGSIPAVVTTLIGIQLGFFIEQAVHIAYQKHATSFIDFHQKLKQKSCN